MPKTLPLAPRRRPAGAAAKKTVERILASAAKLLDEVGFDDLTTNLIAERAGVNVASLYKYFPNKYAVLMGLADQMRDEQVELLAGNLQAKGEWRDDLDAVLNAYVDLFLSRPGFAELALTMSSSPPLREVDEASLAAEAQVIAERIVSYGIDESRADRAAIARVMLEAARGVLPLVRRSPPAGRKRLMRELRRMLEAYMSSYVEA